MALPYAHGRLTIYGSILSVQSWSVNLGFTTDFSVVTNTNLNTWLSTIQANVLTWWNTANGPKATNSPNTNLQGLRAETYAASGTTAIHAARYSYAAPSAGTAAVYSAAQQACVCSLLTDSSLATARGRIYIPTTGLGLQSNQRYATATVDAMSSATQVLLTALNATTIAGSAVTMVVNGSLGVHNITNVRCDDDPDIQRRRSDKILPSYYKTNTV